MQKRDYHIEKNNYEKKNFDKADQATADGPGQSTIFG
jgi:hypothetical protein